MFVKQPKHRCLIIETRFDVFEEYTKQFTIFFEKNTEIKHFNA